MDNFTKKLKEKRDVQKRNADETRNHLENLSTTASVGSRVTEKLDETNSGIKKVAQSTDIQGVVDSINQLNMTTFVANKDSWVSIVDNLTALADKVQGVISNLEKGNVRKIEKSFADAAEKLDLTVTRIQDINIEADSEQKQTLSQIAEVLSGLDMSPVINIPQPKVTVNEKEVDFTPLIDVLGSLDKGIDKLSKSQPKLDTAELEDGIDKVEKAINKLINKPIPVPVMPSSFRNSTGGSQALVDPDGHLQVDILTGGGSPAPASASSVTSVASSVTNVTLLASNTLRRQAMFYNDSSAILYLKFGSLASTTSHTIQMAAGSYYELPSPIYTGIITGLWAIANGAARVTELT